MSKKSNKLQVICVSTLDCERNQEFAELCSIIPDSQMIDFYTSDLDELSIVAKYRILPVPTFIVLCNSKVIGRIVKPPKAEDMADILQTIKSMFS